MLMTPRESLLSAGEGRALDEEVGATLEGGESNSRAQFRSQFPSVRTNQDTKSALWVLVSKEAHARSQEKATVSVTAHIGRDWQSVLTHAGFKGNGEATNSEQLSSRRCKFRPASK